MVDLPKGAIDKVRNSVPMGFVGLPEDAAHVVAFPAPAMAPLRHRQTILIDGGRWTI